MIHRLSYISACCIYLLPSQSYLEASEHLAEALASALIGERDRDLFVAVNSFKLLDEEGNGADEKRHSSFTKIEPDGLNPPC